MIRDDYEKEAKKVLVQAKHTIHEEALKRRLQTWSTIWITTINTLRKPFLPMCGQMPPRYCFCARNASVTGPSAERIIPNHPARFHHRGVISNNCIYCRQSKT